VVASGAVVDTVIEGHNFVKRYNPKFLAMAQAAGTM
jgi:hypothetical protein